MEVVPGYVSIVFILTIFATVAFLIQAIKAVGIRSLPSQLLIFLLPLWIFFQALLSIFGFYQNTDTMPPRVIIYAVAPALLTIIVFFINFRTSLLKSCRWVC